MAGKGNHSQGEAALPVAVAGIPVILEIQTSLKSEEAEVNQRDSRQETGNSGSARVVPDKDDILEDASEIKQTWHEKLSSSSSLTSSSWTDLSLKMKEVGPYGEKQSKEAKDEDI
nr:hypothetical protein [Tanacetum cinerariifolium]GEW87036.1 hypothetical protein [Tanacetum cinerariifolium]